MIARSHHHRQAFTLIELLVVIALILLIAGMAVAFLPAIGDTARQAQGATMLQQWILTAKQKALRDQVPCGIRLVPFLNPVTGKFDKVRDCQYIEQPDDFPSKVGFLDQNGTPASTVTVTGSTVTCTLNLANKVAPGDHLEILGGGLMHTVNRIISGTPSTMMLNSPFPSQTQTQITTSHYRIVRAPRITGDDLLQLPDPVTIDLDTNGRYGNPLPRINRDNSIDLLFSPTGAVLSSGVTTDTINLWVRDYNVHPGERAPGIPPPLADPSDGQQTIIAIYVRSGLTAAQPPAGPRDPYAFIRDGRTSGK